MANFLLTQFCRKIFLNLYACTHKYYITNKLNGLYQRCLCLIYNDKKAPFYKLLEMNISISIRSKNLRALFIKIFKWYWSISTSIMNEIFTRKHKNQYNFRIGQIYVFQELEVLIIVLRVLYILVLKPWKLFQQIWKYQILLKAAIKKWKPESCSRRLFKVYLHNRLKHTLYLHIGLNIFRALLGI